MTQPRRRHVPGGIYLVSSTGEHGHDLFVDARDRAALGELVAQVLDRCNAKVHAFRWLDNELLMVLQVYGVSLSGIMQRITSVHARRVNEKLGYKGALFQHPHRAILLEDADSVLKAVAAVHGRPFSRWSGHPVYLGDEDVRWVTKRMVLGLLSTTPNEQLTAYEALIDREEAAQQLLFSHRRGPSRNHVRRPYDQFLAWMKRRSEERARPASLDQLIQAIARWFQIDPAAIESAATSPLLSLARALIVWSAMENDIASLAELALRFHRGRSTLHETRETYRMLIPQLFDIRLTEILVGPAIAASEVLALLEAARQRVSSRR